MTQMRPKRKVDLRQFEFLFRHGWSRKELAIHFGVHPHTIDNNIKLLGLTEKEPPPNKEQLNAAIKATKRRIERMLNHHNKCEFTWEENVVELLWGLRRLVALKRR